jgi:hypothetical protein
LPCLVSLFALDKNWWGLELFNTDVISKVILGGAWVWWEIQRPWCAVQNYFSHWSCSQVVTYTAVNLRPFVQVLFWRYWYQCSTLHLRMNSVIMIRFWCSFGQ